MPTEYELHLKIRVADTPGAQPEVLETCIVDPTAPSTPDAGVFAAWEEMIEEYEKRQSELEARVEQLSEELAQARAQAEMATALLNQDPEPELQQVALVNQPQLQVVVPVQVPHAPQPQQALPRVQAPLQPLPQLQVIQKPSQPQLQVVTPAQIPAVQSQVVPQTLPPLQVQALAHPQAMLAQATPAAAYKAQQKRAVAQQVQQPARVPQAPPSPAAQRYHTPSTTYAVGTGTAFEPSFTEEGVLDPLAGLKQVLGLAPKRYDLDPLSDNNDTVDGPDELMPEPWYKRIGRGSMGSF